MSRRKSKKSGNNNKNITALVVAIAATALVLFILSGKSNPFVSRIEAAVKNYSSSAVAAQNSAAQASSQTQKGSAPVSSAAAKSGILKISFIDVGQGDGILLTRAGHGMLIDAGTEQAAGTVVNYIKAQKLSALDFCIGTHPHEDHIGGMDSVINAFSLGTLIMPNVTTNTKSFSDVLYAVQKKKLKITRPVPGKTYSFEGAAFTVLAPNSAKYDELNNYSVVIRLVYGSTSFLFTGDAQTVSEQEMLAKGYNLKADVLKVGHHGSKTSTSAAFLKAVSPKYAVISVGKGNDYGLPAQSTVSRLTGAGIKLYRTDRDGTVVAQTDGKTLSFKTNAAA